MTENKRPMNQEDNQAPQPTETCAQVLERYNGVWIEISWRRWSGVVGIYRLILGRECNRQKEHLRVLLQLGINNDYLIYKEANRCSTQFIRGKIYGYL
jgi:hypothetical protein